MAKGNLNRKQFDVNGSWIKENDPELYEYFIKFVKGQNPEITEEQFDTWMCRYRFVMGRYKKPMLVLSAGSTMEKMELGDINVKVSLDYVSHSMLELYDTRAEPIYLMRGEDYGRSSVR